MHLIDHLDLAVARRQTPETFNLADTNKPRLLRQIIRHTVQNTGHTAIGSLFGGDLQNRITLLDWPRRVIAGLGPTLLAVMAEQLLLTARMNPATRRTDIILQGQ